MKSSKNVVKLSFGIGGPSSKVVIASLILWDIWVTTTFTYLETNVAHHWDILVQELQIDGKTHWIGNLWWSSYPL